MNSRDESSVSIERIGERKDGPADSDPQLAAINQITERVIGAAIEVHRVLGPGLGERVYADALAIELDAAGIAFEREVSVPAIYKGHQLGHYVIDFIVEGSVVVEVKAVDRHAPVFEAQVITYLRLTHIRVGLLINFNSRLLRDGVKRFAV